MNRIEINFEECDPAPSRGYIVWWRVAGSSDPLTNAGNFYNSPAVFFDDTNIAGTIYEGFVQSDIPGTVCAQIPWHTGESSGSSSGTILYPQYVYHAEIYLCSDCAIPIGETDVARIGLPAILFRYYGSTNSPGTIIYRPIYEVIGAPSDIMTSPGLLTCVERCEYIDIEPD